MSISTLILGQSGTGKTASLRNLDPAQTALIKAVEKPLPFRAQGWSQYTSDAWEKIIKAMRQAVANGKSVIVVDDFQYVMVNEFMRRSDEKSFDKFSDIANHAWNVVVAASALPAHVRVYLLSHTQEDDYGKVKAKTIGKLIDEKITLEGLFTMVLRTQVQDGAYQFRTTNNGSDTVKAPMGMFDDEIIENDLAAVDQAVCDYYGITQQQEQSA